MVAIRSVDGHGAVCMSFDIPDGCYSCSSPIDKASSVQLICACNIVVCRLCSIHSISRRENGLGEGVQCPRCRACSALPITSTSLEVVNTAVKELFAVGCTAFPEVLKAQRRDLKLYSSYKAMFPSALPPIESVVSPDYLMLLIARAEVMRQQQAGSVATSSAPSSMPTTPVATTAVVDLPLGPLSHLRFIPNAYYMKLLEASPRTSLDLDPSTTCVICFEDFSEGSEDTNMDSNPFVVVCCCNGCHNNMCRKCAYECIKQSPTCRVTCPTCKRGTVLENTQAIAMQSMLISNGLTELRVRNRLNLYSKYLSLGLPLPKEPEFPPEDDRYSMLLAQAEATRQDINNKAGASAATSSRSASRATRASTAGQVIELVPGPKREIVVVENVFLTIYVRLLQCESMNNKDPTRRLVSAATQVPLLSTIIGSDAESVYDAIWGLTYRWFRVDDYKLIPNLQDASIDITAFGCLENSCVEGTLVPFTAVPGVVSRRTRFPIKDLNIYIKNAFARDTTVERICGQQLTPYVMYATVAIDKSSIKFKHGFRVILNNILVEDGTDNLTDQIATKALQNVIRCYKRVFDFIISGIFPTVPRRGLSGRSVNCNLALRTFIGSALNERAWLGVLNISDVSGCMISEKYLATIVARLLKNSGILCDDCTLSESLGVYLYPGSAVKNESIPPPGSPTSPDATNMNGKATPLVVTESVTVTAKEEPLSPSPSSKAVAIAVSVVDELQSTDTEDEDYSSSEIPALSQRSAVSSPSSSRVEENAVIDLHIDDDVDELHEENVECDPAMPTESVVFFGTAVPASEEPSQSAASIGKAVDIAPKDEPMAASDTMNSLIIESVGSDRRVPEVASTSIPRKKLIPKKGATPTPTIPVSFVAGKIASSVPDTARGGIMSSSSRGSSSSSSSSNSSNSSSSSSSASSSIVIDPGHRMTASNSRTAATSSIATSNDESIPSGELSGDLEAKSGGSVSGSNSINSTSAMTTVSTHSSDNKGKYVRSSGDNSGNSARGSEKDAEIATLKGAFGRIATEVSKKLNLESSSASLPLVEGARTVNLSVNLPALSTDMTSADASHSEPDMDHFVEVHLKYQTIVAEIVEQSVFAFVASYDDVVGGIVHRTVESESLYERCQSIPCMSRSNPLYSLVRSEVFEEVARLFGDIDEPLVKSMFSLETCQLAVFNLLMDRIQHALFTESQRTYSEFDQVACVADNAMSAAELRAYFETSIANICLPHLFWYFGDENIYLLRFPILGLPQFRIDDPIAVSFINGKVRHYNAITSRGTDWVGDVVGPKHSGQFTFQRLFSEGIQARVSSESSSSIDIETHVFRTILAMALSHFVTTREQSRIAVYGNSSNNIPFGSPINIRSQLRRFMELSQKMRDSLRSINAEIEGLNHDAQTFVESIARSVSAIERSERVDSVCAKLERLVFLRDEEAILKQRIEQTSRSTLRLQDALRAILAPRHHITPKLQNETSDAPKPAQIANRDELKGVPLASLPMGVSTAPITIKIKSTVARSDEASVYEANRDESMYSKKPDADASHTEPAFVDGFMIDTRPSSGGDDFRGFAPPRYNIVSPNRVDVSAEAKVDEPQGGRLPQVSSSDDDVPRQPQNLSYAKNKHSGPSSAKNSSEVSTNQRQQTANPKAGPPPSYRAGRDPSLEDRARQPFDGRRQDRGRDVDMYGRKRRRSESSSTESSGERGGRPRASRKDRDQGTSRTISRVGNEKGGDKYPGRFDRSRGSVKREVSRSRSSSRDRWRRRSDGYNDDRRGTGADRPAGRGTKEGEARGRSERPSNANRERNSRGPRQSTNSRDAKEPERVVTISSSAPSGPVPWVGKERKSKFDNSPRDLALSSSGGHVRNQTARVEAVEVLPIAPDGQLDDLRLVSIPHAPFDAYVVSLAERGLAVPVAATSSAAASVVTAAQSTLPPSALVPLVTALPPSALVPLVSALPVSISSSGSSSSRPRARAQEAAVEGVEEGEEALGPNPTAYDAYDVDDDDHDDAEAADAPSYEVLRGTYTKASLPDFAINKPEIHTFRNRPKKMVKLPGNVIEVLKNKKKQHQLKKQEDMRRRQQEQLALLAKQTRDTQK